MIGVLFLAGEGTIFSSAPHPDQLWGPPRLLSSRYQGLCPQGKVARVWSWPPTSIERIVLLDFIHRLESQKIEEKYIYKKNHNTHIQNSHKGQLLTTEPLTWVHTQHKPLKQVGHQWQTNDPATAHFTAIKTWETQVSHTNQGTRTPTYTLKH
jgi:hypothetical protein